MRLHVVALLTLLLVGDVAARRSVKKKDAGRRKRGEKRPRKSRKDMRKEKEDKSRARAATRERAMDGPGAPAPKGHPPVPPEMPKGPRGADRGVDPAAARDRVKHARKKKRPLSPEQEAAKAERKAKDTARREAAKRDIDEMHAASSAGARVGRGGWRRRAARA